MKHFKFSLLAAALIPAALLSSCGPKQLSDKEILTLIYNQTDGENWRDSNKEGWLTAEDLNDWYGVVANDEGRVTSLKIYDAKGIIPAEISGLTELETLYINMDNSQKDGDPADCLPSSIGKLANLKDLSLSVRVPCAVPPLDELYQLEKLNLYFNEATYPETVGSNNLTELTLNGFDGSIPAWVYEQSYLKRLVINPDKLESGIAPELANLGDLEHLQIDYSQFIGSVDVPDSDFPSEAFFSLRNLKNVFIRGAATSGTLPEEIDMPELKSLALVNLGLTGELPKALGDLPKIETLKLYNNDFTGGIPAELCKATTLKTVWLDHNHLSGELPKEIGNLVNLESLNVSKNELSGQIPAELAKCTKLGKGVFTKFSGNQFSPDIPAQVKAMEYFEKFEF